LISTSAPFAPAGKETPHYIKFSVPRKMPPKNRGKRRQSRIGLVKTPWVATVNAFLTVGFFVLLGQAHDEFESEFIVATTAGTSHC
jgi:hypothetical protein